MTLPSHRFSQFQFTARYYRHLRAIIIRRSIFMRDSASLARFGAELLSGKFSRSRGTFFGDDDADGCWRRANRNE